MPPALPERAKNKWWTPAEEYFLVYSDYLDFVWSEWIPEWEFPDVWAPPRHSTDLGAWLLRRRGLKWGPEAKAGDGTEWRHDRFKRRRWPPGDGSEDIGDAVLDPIDYEQAVAWVRAHGPGESKNLRAVRCRSDTRWSWLSKRAQERRLRGGVGRRGARPGNAAERRNVDRALQVAFLVYAGLIATRSSKEIPIEQEDGSVKWLEREVKESACDAVRAVAKETGRSTTYQTIEKKAWHAYKPYFPFLGMTLREGEVYEGEVIAQQRPSFHRGPGGPGYHKGRPGEDTTRRIQHADRIQASLGVPLPDAVRQIEEEFEEEFYKWIKESAEKYAEELVSSRISNLPKALAIGHSRSHPRLINGGNGSASHGKGNEEAEEAGD